MKKFQFVIALSILLILSSCSQESSTDGVRDEILIVSQPATDSIVFISPKYKTELNRLKLGKLPHNIRQSTDGKSVFVTLVGSQAIAEIDLKSQTLTRTFLTETVPTNNDKGQLIEGHISEQADLHNSCFDCHNATVDGVKPAVVGSRPFGIAVTDNQIIVANSASETLSYIDLKTGEIIKTVDILTSNDAHEPTELAIMDARIYVTVRPTLPSFAAAELRAYDLESGEFLYSTEVGSAVADLKIDQENKLIYITNFESNTVEKFTADLELLETFIVGNGPFGLSISQNKIIVANYYNNSLSTISQFDNTINSRDLQRDARFFGNPTHISRSIKRDQFYLVSGGTNGYLLTLDESTLAVKDSMEIDGLAFDILTIDYEKRVNK